MALVKVRPKHVWQCTSDRHLNQTDAILSFAFGQLCIQIHCHKYVIIPNGVRLILTFLKTFKVFHVPSICNMQFVSDDIDLNVNYNASELIITFWKIEVHGNKVCNLFVTSICINRIIYFPLNNSHVQFPRKNPGSFSYTFFYFHWNQHDSLFC